jgi:thymidine kinase
MGSAFWAEGLIQITKHAMAKLNFRYASMAAGKSLELLMAAHNYEQQGMPVLLFTAALDDRRGVGRIASRLGIESESHVFDGQTDFRETLRAKTSENSLIACVLVDEAQFLTPQQVRHLHYFANTGDIPVICYGLRTDFLGRSFSGSAELLSLADSLQEIVTICGCRKKASMNARYDANGKRQFAGNQVQIGGNESYRALCPACFYSDTTSVD